MLLNIVNRISRVWYGTSIEMQFGLKSFRVGVGAILLSILLNISTVYHYVTYLDTKVN